MKKIKIIFEKVKKFFTKLTKHKFIAHSIMGAAMFFVILTVIIPTKPVYGFTYEDNDYLGITHAIFTGKTSNDYFEGVYGTLYESGDFDYMVVKNVGWNKLTHCISFIDINYSVGFNEIKTTNASELFPLISISGGNFDQMLVYTTYSTIAGSRIYLSNGLKTLEITTDVNNDYFVGFILNWQFDTLAEDPTTINTQYFTIQVLQYINDNWNVISYPEYYSSFQNQSFTLSSFLPGDKLISYYPSYSSTYILGYEHLSGNLLDNSGTEDKPIQNYKVWNNNALSMLKFLEGTTGLPNSGYKNVDMVNSAYNSGYDSGKDYGYQEGYNVGLQEGENATTNWIATISKGIGNVLSLEIAPNLPLGLLVAIPLVMGMIGLIFMFWRKD